MWFPHPHLPRHNSIHSRVFLLQFQSSLVSNDQQTPCCLFLWMLSCHLHDALFNFWHRWLPSLNCSWVASKTTASLLLLPFLTSGWWFILWDLLLIMEFPRTQNFTTLSSLLFLVISSVHVAFPDDAHIYFSPTSPLPWVLDSYLHSSALSLYQHLSTTCPKWKSWFLSRNLCPQCLGPSLILPLPSAH